MDKLQVNGVEAERDTVKITVLGVSDQPGIAFSLFHCLASNQINVDMIIQSVGKEGHKDIAFTVASKNREDTLRILEENQHRFTAQKIECEEHVAKVTIVGSGMNSSPGVAAKMFEALFSAGVNIKMISTSETRDTVLIDQRDTEKAVRSICRAFNLEQV